MLNALRLDDFCYWCVELNVLSSSGRAKKKQAAKHYPQFSYSFAALVSLGKWHFIGGIASSKDFVDDISRYGCLWALTIPTVFAQKRRRWEGAAQWVDRWSFQWDHWRKLIWSQSLWASFVRHKHIRCGCANSWALNPRQPRSMCVRLCSSSF